MTNIKIIDSGVVDLTEKAEIDKVIEWLDFTGNEFLLDLTGCFISYDTAYLFDKIVITLSDNDNHKDIRLKTDYRFISEEAMWDWLFRDTSLFESDESRQDDFNVLDAIKIKYNITFKRFSNEQAD